MPSYFRSSIPTALIEALTFDAIAGARSATARLNDGRSLKLEYQGTGFADRNQAIPIHFAVGESTRGLRMGQLMTVLAETKREPNGNRSAAHGGSSGRQWADDRLRTRQCRAFCAP